MRALVTKNSLRAAQKIAPAGPPITVGSRNFVREPIMTTAGTAEDRAAIQRYLAEHRVTELLYQVLESICVEKPANPHQYIVDYLSKNHAGLVTVAASDAAAAATAEADDDYVNELLQEDEDDDDDVGELPQQPPPMMPPVAGNASRRRSAVSAESMNAAALQMQYKKMVYEKTAANRATLNDILKENFLFKGLDGDQMTTLLDAMFMANFEAGKAIIEQGAEGDNFYVVFEGECEVFVSKGGDEKMVLACGKGDSFGELALMYNAPRAATVRAKTDCVLFAVDRITFKFILMDTTTKKRNLYDSFLKNVPILATLTEYERSTISDALTEATFGDGETIISQGEAGDAFYIVEEGEVVCTATPPGAGKTPQVIGRCAKGEYFGEIALLTDRRRACTVKAVGPTKVLSLQRKTFTRVMGPLQELLKRNMGAYNSYMLS